MPDFPDSTETAADPSGAPPIVRDAESDRPFREVFARRLPPEIRRDLENAARMAYSASLEQGRDGHAYPDENDTRGRLNAAVVDLLETAELLRAIGRDHRASGMDWPSTMLSILATPRQVEIKAIVERIESMLAWESTTARLFPPRLVEAEVVPSSYRPEPIE